MNYNFAKAFIMAVFIIVIVFMGLRLYLISDIKDGGTLYEITILGNKNQETTFFTKKYVEENGCVKFKDEFGRSHRVCGMYNITEY